jgi:G:T-mismatch repair DNA endonuclease (very short patch repair protein)
MDSSLRKEQSVLLLVGFWLALASALNVTVPDTIIAGQKIQIEVGFDFWKQHYVYEEIPDSPAAPWTETKIVCRNPATEDGCSNDLIYEHYQLYLYTNHWSDICT